MKASGIDGFLLGLFFYSDDGGGMFLRNVCWLSTDYMTLYPDDSYLNIKLDLKETDHEDVGFIEITLMECRVGSCE
jgi:hypothetical protein